MKLIAVFIHLRHLFFCFTLGFLYVHCAAHFHNNRVFRNSQLSTPEEGIFHITQDKESLRKIARVYKIPLSELMQTNDLLEEQLSVERGSILFIPRAHIVLALKNFADTDEDHIGTKNFHFGRFIWPIQAPKITSRFGQRFGRPHEGIDIGAKEGTPVLAAEKGIVRYAGNEQRGYGNLIIIEHDEHFITIYAHNHINLVKENMFIKQGELIAYVGKTGHATGPHLHFEIRKNKKPQDPLIYLDSNSSGKKH